MDRADALPALVCQLEQSQWAAPDAIRASQLRHAGGLADHCARQSRDFARRLQGARVSPADLATEQGFERLPVMTRRDVQAAGSDLYCREVPASHGVAGETATSGSTGEPVVARRTMVSALFANAMAVRELRWQRRDLSGRLCLVRARASRYSRHADWGTPANLLGRTGPMLTLPVTADVRQLVDWIAEFDPTLLVLYPSTLRALVGYVAARAVRLPALRQILTTGETLAADLRESAEAGLGATLTDCYSSEEFGCIAAQCPDGDGYHVMAESLLVEVLDDAGDPCAPGEIGRVVVTDLHNYATPFIRYDIGDRAQVATPCPCGRGLPTWTRIVGRERNLVVLPDGRRHWPVTGFLRIRDIAPIAQYQFVQQSLEEVELRLVTDRPLTSDEEQRIRTVFRDSIGHPFSIGIRYFPDRLPCGSGGKFEEFVSRVEAC